VNIRRKVLLALGAGTLVSPFASLAQQVGKVWRVGVLSDRKRPAKLDLDYYNGFVVGMREHGYVEGKNLFVDWRFVEGKLDLHPPIAAEFVREKVDAILVASTSAAIAAQKATTTIPIVMATVGNPVMSGLVKSLARPGGNITGLTNFSSELSPKQLDLLRDLVPTLSTVAVLINPDNSGQVAFLNNAQAAGKATNIKVLPFEARTLQEIEAGFSRSVRERASAVIVSFDSLFNEHRLRIAELALKHRLPSISGRTEYVESGFLMSYGPSTRDIFRRAATHVDKIFQGAKPADLPVEQPTSFELAVNVKTAKALSIKIPQSVLIRADKVIE
jgi:putative ABC transport system substrate-binding protein